MNPNTVADLVAQLDSAVPKEGAAVLFQQYGHDPDESRIVANPRGFQRLGIEFLKCGVTAQQGEASARHAALEIRYLLSEQSDIWFDEFEVSDTISLEEVPVAGGSNVVPAFCCILFLLILVAILALAVVGLISLFG